MNIFERGYAWAMNGLMEGSVTPPEIEANVEKARDFNDYDDFDRGAEQALKNWRARYDHTGNR
jgi:hypothetical protein